MAELANNSKEDREEQVKRVLGLTGVRGGWINNLISRLLSTGLLSPGAIAAYVEYIEHEYRLKLTRKHKNLHVNDIAVPLDVDTTKPPTLNFGLDQAMTACGYSHIEISTQLGDLHKSLIELEPRLEQLLGQILQWASESLDETVDDGPSGPSQ